MTRAKELEGLNRWMARHPRRADSEGLSEAVRSHVEIAIDRANDRNPWRAITGSSLQGAATNLDAAEACLLRFAPDSYLRGQMSSFLAHVRRHLAPHDPRRLQLEELSAARGHRRHLNGNAPAEPRQFSEEERGVIVSAVRAASSAGARELMLAKSFLNTLILTSAILILLAALTAVFGFVSPDTISLCFAPETAEGLMVVCPTGQEMVTPPDTIDEVMDRTAGRWDLFTVEALGLTAAAISAAVALRNIHGTHTPIGIPISLAILKLPLGALTAVLGLLLMRGGFVPGLSALDSPPQILAWAVLFGYAQQIFTRFVDQQANVVLDRVAVNVPEDTAPDRAAPVRERLGGAAPESRTSTAGSPD